MERFILKKLLDWRNSPYRKPLILKGVRQVGKTWILKEFGRHYYENTAYFNFDENEEYKQFFETTKDVNRILQNLMLASGQKIEPEKTLIIFDEVQDCPKVINSMKYFCENAPQYHIACAGSLLGIALAKPSSFPVGKVNFMQIDPMTFTEFLLANGDENLARYLETVNAIEPIPDAFFNPLYEKLKMYYVTGGMPESVKMWTEARDVSAMQEVLSGIIGAYERGRIIRPLLQTGRAEIEDYLQKNGLPHVEDSTNEDTHYARNRLRRELWPQLETVNPAVTRAIGRTAEIVRGENAYLDTLAAERLPAEGTAVETAALLAAPEPLRPRMVRLLLDRLPTGKKDVSAVHMDAVLALAEGGGTLDLPGGARAVCRNGWLRLTVKETAPPEMVLAQGLNRWGDYDITLRGGEEHRVTVRSWKGSDRMAAERGSRSLKRLFADAGIPAELRDSLPVVCVDGTPHAVYGIKERTAPHSGETIQIIINKRENHKEDTGNG